MNYQTREPQYNSCLNLAKNGLTTFGLMSNEVWHGDPKRLGFVIARYKFVAKMMSGLNHVLEVGCADAFGTRVVQQEVKHVTAVDFDPVFVEDVNRRMDPAWPLRCITHDLLCGPVEGNFDGAYALDVIEHIPKTDEDRFLSNMVKSLQPHGICILGSPSLESQPYASAGSKLGHVNCKSGNELRSLMGQFFHNVFIFSMNDEVVHTGFHKMAHYLLAIGCARR